MSEVTKIFISSKQKELEIERAWAKEATEETGHDLGKDLKAVLVEEETAPPSTTVHIQCSGELKGCKAVICIYYKTISPIVKNEFHWANEREIPIFIFKKEPNGNDDADEQLKKFIKEEVGPPLGDGTYEKYVYKAFIGEDIKDKIKASLKEHYPFNKAIPEKYLPYAIESGESERLERIRHVYVKPRCYAKAEEILKSKHLLIITGPAHLGKTSMGFHMADSFTKDNISRRFFVFPESGDLSEIAGIHNRVILFDDPFGGSAYRVSPFGDRFDKLQELARKNYIIVTSRREVLNEAIKYTKIGEKNLKDLTIEIAPEDYGNKDFEVILERHLEYFKADSDIRALASCYKDEIIKELRFPHNYERLVGEELRKVIKKEKGFRHALSDAKEIERAVGQWFENWYKTDKEVFCFLLTLALCGEFEEEDFKRIYRNGIERLNKERGLGLPLPGSLARLRKATAAYVSQERPCAFQANVFQADAFQTTIPLRLEHPSYREGIIGCTINLYHQEARFILQEMAADNNCWVRYSAVATLGQMAERYPEEELLSILGRLTGDKEAVVQRHAAFTLWNTGQAIPSLRGKMSEFCPFDPTYQPQ